jgi:alkaline phosphatase D
MQTDGPLVGGVTERSARIFVRTDVPALVQIEYSTLPDLNDSEFSDTRYTDANRDYTTIIDLDNLEPQTIYYYRILVDGVSQQLETLPSFETFPRSHGPVSFRFAIVADVLNSLSYPEVPAPVYQQVAAADPKFVLQIGDFDHRNPQTLSGMRNMHRDVRGEYSIAGHDFLEQIASRFPVFHTWDDHDYGVNNGDKNWVGRSDALQAFDEYYPTPERPNSAGIWYKFSYANCEFFMLDVRSQRDPDTDPDGPEKSMLDGDNILNGQKQWLLDGLLASNARWKFLVSGVPFNPTSKPDDGWSAFETERSEIMRFIVDNDIEGVILVSGDLHSGGAIDLGDHSGYPEISVPHTNLAVSTPASGIVGDWSGGFIPGTEITGGATLITVMGRQDSVELRDIDTEGETTVWGRFP